jgi:uncharacterized membrane protein YccC
VVVTNVFESQSIGNCYKLLVDSINVLLTALCMLIQLRRGAPQTFAVRLLLIKRLFLYLIHSKTRPVELPFNLRKSEVVDALRLALQSAAAAMGAYGVMRYFDLPETFVAVLSAVLVVGPSIGNTFSEAQGRIVSTIVGGAIGFALVTLLPWGVGTAISLGICMFVINMVAGFKPSWRYGVVAAVAIALGSESEALAITIDRLTGIGIGVGVGIFVALSVLPDKAESRAKRYLRRALRNASERFEIAVENTRIARKEQKKAEETADNFYNNLSYAKGSAKAIKFNKDKNNILQQIENAEKLYHSILIVHRVADRSDEGVSDSKAGIEETAEEVRQKACAIIEQLAEKELADDIDLEQFSELVTTTKKNINTDASDKHLNMQRHTFIFGLTEIEESLQNLLACMREERRKN